MSLHPKDEATYAAFALGWTAVRKMPERTAYATFSKVADRTWKRRGAGVAQLEKNLKRVVPEASPADLREMSRESMRKYFRYWCDAFRMPDWTPERIVGSFSCLGEQNLIDNLAAGPGIVIAVSHMGNWDHAGAWVNLVHSPVTSVAERLKPERLFEKFLAYRRSLGLRIYPLGEPNLIDTLCEELRTEKRIVGLLADRDLTARGIPVSFFGEPTRMPAGPANLSLRTKSPLVAASLWYDGPKSFARIYPLIAIPEGAPTGDNARNEPGYAKAIQTMTQQVANHLESGIREHPTDWHMLQKLWLSDLDPARLAASDAKGGG